MTETKTIRVRPVAGRLVRDETTRQPIAEEGDVIDTRTIRRRIADGDLELVGDASDQQAAREADPRADTNEAWGIGGDPNAQPPSARPEDTALTRDERDATRAADQELERGRY